MSGPWAPPWRIEFNRSLRRARIVDAEGVQVANGMNLQKAEQIVGCVNRDAVARDSRLANETSLLVLCAIRGGQSWSAGMLKDIDTAIKANQNALAAIAKATTD